MKNFRVRLDKIMACTIVSADELADEVLNKLEETEPKDRFKISFLEFSIVDDKICVYTIKANPYFRKEFQTFEFLSNAKATSIFQDLSSKIEKDGCKLLNSSETSFKIATKPSSPIS